MSRITGVALLLIILVAVLYESSGHPASHAGFRVTKAHIRKCRCRFFGAKMKCRVPLLPTTNAEKQELVKCFCSKANHHKFPEFRAACRSSRPDVPITMV